MTVPKWRRDNHEKGNKKGWQDATSAAEKLFKHTLLKTGGKLRKQKKLLEAGEMTMQDVETSFQCWQSGLLQQKCYYQVLQMRRYYWDLYERRAPEWKTKFRQSKMQEKIILSSMPEHIQWECCVNGMKPQ